MTSAMATATAGLCCGCLGYPTPQTYESMAAISGRRHKPLRSLWSANSASSPSSGKALTEQQCFPPRWALSNVGSVAPRTTYHREGDRERPNRMVAEVDEQNGGQPQQERRPFPRPPVILWEKHSPNAVQLIGRVEKDIDIKYSDSGKIVATTSLALHKGCQRTEDPSCFTLEICDDLAEIAAHYVAKGELIFVSGKIVVDSGVKDGFGYSIVKVVVRDICFVEPSSDRRQPYGQSNDEFPVRGYGSQSEAAVASMVSSQRNWTQQQLSRQPSPGAILHGNNVAQLEAQSPQTRAGASKREAAKMTEQNRNSSLKVVGGIESRQQNTDRSKVEVKGVGDIEVNLTRSMTAIDVREIREPEPLSGEEDGQSSRISEGAENSLRQDLRTGKLLSGRSTPASLKARLHLISQGRLQSSASYSSRVWSRDTAQGNGSTHVFRAGTTREAIAGLQNRLQRGITTKSFTYIKILQMCLQHKDLSAAKQVHKCITESGMDKNPYVASTLLNVYIKCGGLLNARRVFDQLEKKNVITWTSMISGYAKSNHAESALELFNQMRQEGLQPDEITYLSILKACANPLALNWGKEVHLHIRHAGFESDVRVGSALIHMYAKCGCITEARKAFEMLTNRNVLTWNVMIGAYAERGHGIEAYQLFLQMRQDGFEPDAFTYASILNASASEEALEWMREVHAHASKAGLESDLRVGSALVHMYAKRGRIDDARLVFDRMTKRDVVTWTVMIGGLAQHGCGHEAYQLFLQMRREGFEPDAFTFASMLNASASAGALGWVKEVHRHASEAGVESDLRVGNALVHMYAESGSIDDARLVFDKMEKRNVVTWNTMLGGLAQHGLGHETLAVFQQMNWDRVKPDGTSFVAVLSACSHAGLVDDGHRLFLAMSQDYGIEPTVIHYTCMVDLLGRAGQLGEAKRFIRGMPIEPNRVTWTTFLGACRTYGNVELGKFAANELFKLEPNRASTYVLLSNIYAAAGKWEEVSVVRTMMQMRGVRKEPGRSWIEVDNKIHEFVVGDTSHPEAKAIYTELNKLTEKLKAEGYVPDTRLVLHDISAEDKELALCSHSEKLAIVYGLMHLPGGDPIRLRKNLRVCADCHTATKLISKVTGREIIARDTNRFHHFKDGVCSCGDYW